MLLSDVINEQMKQYAVCNEDFNEILQEMNRIEDRVDEEPFYCFLSGSAGVGKSHVTKASYQAALKYYNTRPGINFN